VVSGNHEYRDSGIGYLEESPECLEYQGRRDPRPMEKVAAVDHQIG
jgi:hypothetical protein